jgi:hypothetical protein
MPWICAALLAGHPIATRGMLRAFLPVDLQPHERSLGHKVNGGTGVGSDFTREAQPSGRGRRGGRVKQRVIENKKEEFVEEIEKQVELTVENFEYQHVGASR